MKSICPNSTSNKRHSNQNGFKRIIDAASAILNNENNHQTTTDISLQEEDKIPFGDDADEGNNIDNESPPPKMMRV